MIADFSILQAFLITMGVMSIPWALFWIWKYRKDPDTHGLWTGFKKTINISKVKPGMVLAKDNFMHGLDEKEIEQFKKQGHKLLEIKQPMPYIPVVFGTLLVTTFFPLTSFLVTF